MNNKDIIRTSLSEFQQKIGKFSDNMLNVSKNIEDKITGFEIERDKFESTTKNYKANNHNLRAYSSEFKFLNDINDNIIAYKKSIHMIAKNSVSNIMEQKSRVIGFNNRQFLIELPKLLAGLITQFDNRKTETSPYLNEAKELIKQLRDDYIDYGIADLAKQTKITKIGLPAK